MIHKTKPINFKAKFEAVGCFVLCDGEMILLHRQSHKPQGDTWGIPSGKIDAGEDAHDTACRETAEETGIVIARNEMKFFASVYVRFDDYDFVYHMYSAQLKNKPEIKISQSEHKAAKWISPKEALSLPLIEDLDVCMELFFGF